MIIRYSLTLLALLLFSALYLNYNAQINTVLQWQLISGKTPQLFVEFVYYFATLPRLAMALMVGAILGLVGSLLQQITRNPLLSPLTLGTSAGAWLALIIVSIAAPGLAPNLTALAVMFGSIIAMCLVLLIAGYKELAGLRVILAGMAVNILLGAITSAIIILRDQFAKNLFIWGAGDLAQNDWQWMQWLAPKLIIAIVILFLAPRVLQLLRVGQQAARSLGLATTPMLIILFGAAIKSARDELYYSTLLGALLLLLADFIARIVSTITIDIIPSGTATAMVGAPLLIYLALRSSRAEDQLSMPAVSNTSTLTYSKCMLVLTAAIISTVAAMYLNNDGLSWRWNIPTDFDISTRTPRIIIAFGAGICMAVAGVVLQRLIKNPLASPDLLGVSAGASAAIVITSLLTGKSLIELNPFIALLGSAAMLFILMLLTRVKPLSGGSILLLGISLTAMVEALVQFFLAKGSQDVYSILSWLAGSTYHAQQKESLILPLLGAHHVRAQLLVASLLGATILLLADWLGRNILYPSQVAAGTLAAALGGGYFVVLLLKAKINRSSSI